MTAPGVALRRLRGGRPRRLPAARPGAVGAPARVRALPGALRRLVGAGRELLGPAGGATINVPAPGGPAEAGGPVPVALRVTIQADGDIVVAVDEAQLAAAGPALFDPVRAWYEDLRQAATAATMALRTVTLTVSGVAIAATAAGGPRGPGRWIPMVPLEAAAAGVALPWLARRALGAAARRSRPPAPAATGEQSH